MPDLFDKKIITLQVMIYEMNCKKNAFLLVMMLLFVSIMAHAQNISGKIIGKDGGAIPYASISYKGLRLAVSSDKDGLFSIPRRVGGTLVISSVGYQSIVIRVTSSMTDLGKLTLQEESRSLNEVVVKSKSGRYRRKDNPAVELMKKVIAAKAKTDLKNHDYFQYNRYQKITMAFNNITEKQLQGNFLKKRQYMLDQIEKSPINDKKILPLSVDETVSQHIYRKNPFSEKEIIQGQQSNGIGNVIETGDILNEVIKDVFTDVDIYNDYVRLLQFPFVSPIGKTAISFYHFYIEDTVYVDHQLCYHLQFIPANQQDFGFRGEIFVLKDSTLHVKKCILFIPQKSDVNWVDNMKIEQKYSQLSNGEWVLSKDDMYAEIHVNKVLQDLLIVRNTRYNDYSFDTIPKQLFRGKVKVRYDFEAFNRDESFWNKYRAVALTKSESSMDTFIHKMQNSKGWKYIIFGVKALIENYVETGGANRKSKFDFGPVNTLVSMNYVDKIRLRLSGRTTAYLNPHWFWSGFAAYGVDSKQWYYSSAVTYSFNKKKANVFEFPQRSLTFDTSSDLTSPSDLNLGHNKDNIFMTRTSALKEVFLYNRQRLSFRYETDWGLRFSAYIQTQSNQTAGELHYYKLTDSVEVHKIRLSDATMGVVYNPGVTYVNTKQQRLPINLDSPEIGISHTVGFKHFLGGQFKSNVSTLSFYKRQWLGSWGYLSFNIRAMAQWNKVPFPLLLQPPVNLSFIANETSFSLLSDWEFLNDRQVFWGIKWNLNGKLLNRIPLIKSLKFREFFAIKGIWGTLTDKNNPVQNSSDERLYIFPSKSHLMGNQPYWEAEFGIHNILKFLSVSLVRRINYLEQRKYLNKWGIRFGFKMTF